MEFPNIEVGQNGDQAGVGGGQASGTSPVMNGDGQMPEIEVLPNPPGGEHQDNS